MPIEFCTSLELDLLYARWWGVIGAQDFTEIFSNYLVDKHCKTDRPELIDLSGIVLLELDFGKVGALLNIFNAQHPGVMATTYTVLWAPNDEL